MAALGVTFPHGRVTGDAAEHTHEHTKKEKNTRGRKQEAQRGSTHHPEPNHLAFLHGTLLIFPMCLPAFSLWALQGKPSPLCFARDPTPLTAPFSLKVKEPKASLREGDGNIGTYFVVGTAHTVQGKVGNELPQNPQSQTLVPHSQHAEAVDSRDALTVPQQVAAVRACRQQQLLPGLPADGPVVDGHRVHARASPAAAALPRLALPPTVPEPCAPQPPRLAGDVNRMCSHL